MALTTNSSIQAIEQYEPLPSRREGTQENGVGELAKDKVLADALGPVAYEAFNRAKWEEWDQYRIHVTGYEIERYLKTA